MTRDDPFDPPRRPGSLGRIAHYEVEAFLGRGAFGTVVRAFDEKLQRQVAIKLLSSNFGPESSAYQRFLREARAAATIRHDNVVQIYAVEETPCAYLVMECVTGETLQDRLDRVGKLEVAEAVTIGAQAARGLAAAHECGLVHRDIKPCNILVETIAGELRVKIADFGLALSKQDARLTQSGMVAGTPMYMAPEQASALSLDGRADLFSLASVLYALLTGVAPFGDTNPSLVLGRIVGHEPKPIRDRAPHVPLAVCKVVAKMHAKNPEHRYQSGREVADALLKALNEPDPPPAPPGFLASRPRRLALALGVVAVAALGTYLAMTALGNGGSGAPASGGNTPPISKGESEPGAQPNDSKPIPTPGIAEGFDWSAPKSLGMGINTKSRELYAALSTDELEIVFVRDNGLMTSLRSHRDEEFPAAQSLALAIGERQYPESVSLSGDGLRLLFQSRKPGDRVPRFWESVRSSRNDSFLAANELELPKIKNVVLASPYMTADGLTIYATANASILELRRPSLNEPFQVHVENSCESLPNGFNIACWRSQDGLSFMTARVVEVRTNPVRNLNLIFSHARGAIDKPFAPRGDVMPWGQECGIGRPWLHPSGRRMYFHTRDLKDGKVNDLDLWYSDLVPKKNP